MNKKRIEKDSLGTVKIPFEAYYGSTTQRALQNFKISGIFSPFIFLQSLGIVKLAAIKSNSELGLIEKKKALAIEKAAQEFIEGKFNDQFNIDIFQAGAGTSYNMNANEIIANRANEILGGKKGDYSLVHPNNHVNMAQSTNDVIPAAIRIAALLLIPKLKKEICLLEKSIEKKVKEQKNILKVGRTHLQDAVVIPLAQEFDSYKEALQKSRKFLGQQEEELKIIGIGGTAVGTGINTDPKYKSLMIKNLSKLFSIKFRSAKNLTEIANNMNSFLNLSSSLRSIATNLLNFSYDLCLMNSGPKAGLSEIILPAVQPGSSIMPGKVNPSIPETIQMVCFQVLGNDRTIELACQRSQFELNVMGPVIMYNLIQSIEILSNGICTLRTLAINELKINREKIKKTLDHSLCDATALSPYLGYHKTAEILNSALKNGRSIREELMAKKILSKEKIEEILSVKNLTQPSRTKSI